MICVSKLLSDRQVELNELVKKLGGDFRWNFDAKVPESFLYNFIFITSDL